MTDENFERRQFLLRTLLVIGLLWGFLPFITVPFITRGANDTYFDVCASVVNSLTILPASALAFWHRRIACVWLSVNGAMLAVALVNFLLRTHQYHAGMIAQVAGPIALALCLDIMEARGWPPAVNRRTVNPRRP